MQTRYAKYIMDIFDPSAFRACHGWKDVAEVARFSKSHSDYFVVPPSEHLMPDSVPKKARCDSCEKDYNRYRTSMRVKRYRLRHKQKLVLDKYISVYQAAVDGTIHLSADVINNLRKVIVENGGTLPNDRQV